VVGAVSRFGPIVPVAPAGWNVWHEAQPFAANTALPAAAFPPPDADVVVAAEVVAADVVGAAEVVVAPEVAGLMVIVCTTVEADFPSEV
jgi:hypothetical protein